MTRQVAALIASLARRFKSTVATDSKAGGVAMSGASPLQLFQALFPGQQYSQERAPELAARLRELADELEPGSAAAGPQPGVQAAVGRRKGEGEGPNKKRRKKGSNNKGIARHAYLRIQSHARHKFRSHKRVADSLFSRGSVCRALPRADVGAT